MPRKATLGPRQPSLRQVEQRLDAQTALIQGMIQAQTAMLHALTDLIQKAANPIVARDGLSSKSPEYGMLPAVAAQHLVPDRLPEEGTDYAAELRAELAEYDEEESTPPPPPDEFETWERRVVMYRKNRMWLDDWGPRPGQPGCVAPPEIVNGRR